MLGTCIYACTGNSVSTGRTWRPGTKKKQKNLKQSPTEINLDSRMNVTERMNCNTNKTRRKSTGAIRIPRSTRKNNLQFHKNMGTSRMSTSSPAASLLINARASSESSRCVTSVRSKRSTAAEGDRQLLRHGRIPAILVVLGHQNKQIPG